MKTFEPLNQTVPEIQTHAQTNVTVKMDYKLILESQYVTKRMCELAQKPLEIGFVYGGTVQQQKYDTHSHTTIDMKRMIVPKKQTVSAGDFIFDYDVLPKLNEYFQEQEMSIVGQGHSHQHLPVYHSQTDRDNYERMTLYCGTKISPHNKTKVASKRRSFSSFSKRTGKKTHYEKKVRDRVKEKPSYVFPSLVFNTKGDVTAGLATSNANKLTVIEDIPILHYNKQAVLTHDDKMRLDKEIYAVLRENNVVFSYGHSAKSPVSTQANSLFQV